MVENNTVSRNPYLLDYTQQRREIRRKQQREHQIQRNRLQINHPQRRTARNEKVRLRAERRRRQMIRRRIFIGVQLVVLVITIVFLVKLFGQEQEAESVNGSLRMKAAPSAEQGSTSEKQIQGISVYDYAKHPAWTEDFLTVNEYSRPGDALTEVNSVFVHYTANPGTSAAQNRSYFEQQKDTHERSVSAHFIIGYEGEIIQCVPLDEIAYAVQTRNEDSVSIECCYVAADGSFTQETYDSLIKLLRWLVAVYDLDVDKDVLRHYDCGGKKCPIYYTENEDAWKLLKEDVKQL